MRDRIRVPFADAESEFTEKRSRFIGHVWKVKDEAEAQARIRDMKSKYYDARHNCWCYIVGQNTLRYSDDGEPQGTAGQPMLKVFERETVTDVCCVVTRYFGGILLGAGGLTRAYSRAARDALAVAGVAELGEWVTARIPCAYGLFEQVKLLLASHGATVDHVDYGAAIAITASVPAESMEAMVKKLTELSAGAIAVEGLRREYRPGPRIEI